MKIGVLVLAAGLSSRMPGNKLLHDLAGKAIVAHVVDAVHASGLGDPIVVVGNSADAVAGALAGRSYSAVHAERHAEGLGQSLRAGILAIPADWDATMVCLGDMPRVAPALLARLAAAATNQSCIVVPVWNGKRGNPVVWGRDHFARLATLSGDVGGKVLLGELADDMVQVGADSDAIFADIDTPADLAAARAHAESSSPPMPKSPPN